MRQRDIGDILGGLLMIGIGVFALWYAQRYSFGTPRAMGPGFFPVVLGGILALLGVMIMLPALRRAGPAVEFSIKPLVVITASIVVFGMALRPLGLVIATILTVLLASSADRSFSLAGRLVLAPVLALMLYLVFKLGLGMTIPVWPRGI